jgi:hypothetical protein
MLVLAEVRAPTTFARSGVTGRSHQRRLGATRWRAPSPAGSVVPGRVSARSGELALPASGSMADIFTDDLLAAMAAPGCPICRVVADSVQRWMESFWREGRNDRTARSAFFAAGGFCREHSLLLYASAQGTRGGAAIADVYRWLAERDIELLGTASKNLAGARRRRRPQLERRSRCPACDETEAATERKLSFLVDALAATRTRERYALSDGLCVPHLLRGATQAAPQPTVGRFLLDDGRRRLIDLQAQLDEFDRKRDHRFRHERKGAEQLAPAQAIRRYAGSIEDPGRSHAP